MVFSQNAAFNGLGTFSTTLVDAGPYFVSGNIMLPTVTAGGGPSSVLVTINQNGSPKYVGVAGASGFKTDLTVAAGDVVAVVFSSSAAADLPLNVIKSTISIAGGQI